MMRVDKPWGHEIIWAKTDKYVGKILHIKSGHKLSRQYHEIKEETIRVLHGTMYLEIGTDSEIETKVLVPGDTYHITPGTVHRMIAPLVETNKGYVEVAEVSTPELNDVVRLQDEYRRV